MTNINTKKNKEKRKMPDYSKGKIYTIRNHNDITLIYVGSTIQPLSVRFGRHKSTPKHQPSSNFHTLVEDWKDWYIELYENFPCNSREELCKREGEIIREISTLNRNIAGRTYKEYCKENSEKMKEKHTKYYKNNLSKCAEKNKLYHTENKQEISEKKKAYYLQNKQTISEKNKLLCVENKQKISERNKIRYLQQKEKLKLLQN